MTTPEDSYKARTLKQLIWFVLVSGGFLALVPNAAAAATIATDTTWALAGSPYVLGEELVVAAGATLSIEPGVVIKSNRNGRLKIFGHLEARGTDGAPIYFTSLKDDTAGGDTNLDGGTSLPAGGDWAWINVVEGGSALLRHTTIRYGGYHWFSGSIRGQVWVEGGNLTMVDSAVHDGKQNGIGVQLVGAEASITSSDIANDLSFSTPDRSNSYGVRIDGGRVELIDNDFHHNGFAGVVIDASGTQGEPVVAITRNSIRDNGESFYRLAGRKTGVICDDIITPDLSNNWWGHETGPKHPRNPEGLGQEIFECDATISPWSTESPEEPGRRPVLLVPGLAGTELWRGGDKIWLDLLSVLIDPDDSFLDVLKMNEDGLPVDDMVSMGDVIRRINDDALISYDYFGGLIEELENAGYEEAVDLFVMPYDWRRSIDQTSELLESKIAFIQSVTGAEKIDVVAHSMGGLVAEYYVKQHPNSHGINKLIFVGTPHLGAPKALKALLWGDNFGIPRALKKEKIREIVKNMHSVYYLLPSSSYFDQSGGYYYNLAQAGSPWILSYIESQALMESRGLNTEARDVAARTLDPGLVDSAFSEIDIEAYNITGCNSPTITGIIERPNDEYYLRIGPGDETVPFVSANYVSQFGARAYYARNVEHGKMSSQRPVRELISLILEGGPPEVGSLPLGVTLTSEGCGVSGKLVSVHSPVELHVYDGDGNHVGPLDDGSIEDNIGGITYEVLGDNKFVFLPDGEFTVDLIGAGTGDFDLRIAKYENEVTEAIYYRDVPVNPSSVGRMIVTPNSTDATFSYDEDGDGIFAEIEAVAVVSGEAVDDITAPTTTIQIDGEQGASGWYRGPATITLEARDDGAGVLRTEYSLDNETTWSSYSTPILHEDDGRFTIAYRSIDRLGNDEPVQQKEIYIDSVAPEFRLSLNLVVGDIEVSGQDDQTGNVSVIEATSGSYMLTDDAGNKTIVTLQKINKDKLVRAEIIGLRYNGIEALIDTTELVYRWSYDKSQVLKTLKQGFSIRGSLKVSANYTSRGQGTTIMEKVAGEKKLRDERPGINELTIFSKTGNINYEFIDGSNT